MYRFPPVTTCYSAGLSSNGGYISARADEADLTLCVYRDAVSVHEAARDGMACLQSRRIKPLHG
jgi:hypothetical protein